jgi:NAD(P)H dehydrogenase (quinone)
VAAPIAFVRANYFFENWVSVLPAVTGQGVLPAFLTPLDRAIPMVAVADIGAAAAELLTGPAWQGRRTIDLASFGASPRDVAAALAEATGKAVHPVAVPREQWAGILRGAGMSDAVAQAFVAMYDGINGGVVVAEAASERRAGATALGAAARALVSDTARGRRTGA